MSFGVSSEHKTQRYRIATGAVAPVEKRIQIGRSSTYGAATAEPGSPPVPGDQPGTETPQRLGIVSAVWLQLVRTGSEATQVERAVRIASVAGETADGKAYITIDPGVPYVKDLIGGVPVFFVKAEGAAPGAGNSIDLVVHYWGG